jgi:hypothetical protein
VRFFDLELGDLLLVGGELLLLVADNSIALDNRGLEFLLGGARVA